MGQIVLRGKEPKAMPKISIITPSNNPKWLNLTMQSVLAQTYHDWEWVVMINNGAKWDGKAPGTDIVDARIRIIEVPGKFNYIGHIKNVAFGYGTGEILLELDHDDCLAPDALTKIAAAFEDPEVGFVYSDFAEFKWPTFEPNLFNAAWGWSYYPGKYKEEGRTYNLQAARAFPVTPASIGYIYWAPNHPRAWRKSVYEALGGHNSELEVADDHDLIVRTYLSGTEFVHIPECLYFYRVYPDQNVKAKNARIQELTKKIYLENITKIALRWSKDNGLHALDLGARFDPQPGYTIVDINLTTELENQGHIKADLSKPWPFADKSVGVIRAYDFLEHLPDKQFTMSEIHRVLAPGGILLSGTPSTDGRGAFQDPTHVAFFNVNSFWYFTKKNIARYIDNTKMFAHIRLETGYPSKWHEENKISYVFADLTPLHDGAPRYPGYEE